MKSSPAADAGVRARGHHQVPANLKPVPPAAPAPPAAPCPCERGFQTSNNKDQTLETGVRDQFPLSSEGPPSVFPGCCGSSR